MSQLFEQNWKGRKAIITGGCGFIGSNLADRLVNLGVQVTLVDSLVPEYGGNLFNISEIKDREALNISDVRDKFRLETLISEQEILFTTWRSKGF
jgi:UDP-glucose 4-epimerase